MALHHTQFLYGSKKENHTIVMGLDFGTSSSKVVLNNRTAVKAYGISFGKAGHPSNPYLIPTRPYFNKSGILCLSSLNDSMPLRELKGSIIGVSPTKFGFDLNIELETEPKILVIAYLAHIIRLSRNWFFTNKRKAFGHAKLDWQLNIGIPTTGKEFESKKQLFKEIATSSWWLSVQEEEITNKLAEKAIEIIKNPDVDLKDIFQYNINVIPEIVAEVIGYAHSDQRNQGLHLMIDVGAGTVDIASFNLGKNEDGDKYSIFSGDVRLLGAFELYKYRIGFVKKES